ncbi:AT-rich interactive domain-containing protein 2-like [Rosa rugosa]|uniref:AT-rich interactive domain-containing protein 2-like n=1 Tax=Rosa rugosa TaxID=74645 RepID=UPI002B405C36|nr:AT-rich interactive domain-containing protein 2-like [Rosa rugosa]
MATRTSDDHRVKRICTGHSVSCLTNTNENNQIFKPQPVCNSNSSGSLLTIEDEYKLKPAYDLTILDDMRKYGPSCKIYPASSLMDSDESAHGWTIVDDMEQYGNSCKEFSTSALIDKDESAHGSNKLTPEYSNLCNATSTNVNDSVNSSDSSSLDECDSELERALRLLISSDDDLPRSTPSAHSSSSLRSSNRNSKAAEILRLLFSDGQYFRKSVPIGPGFQAEVPEWTGPVNRKNRYVGDASKKWLGTRMYPIKRLKNAGADTKSIGKGRPDSCSCVSPGSAGCVKHHIDEARLRLQAEIGPAFRTWKFDEMGEFASKSWTLKEQSTFESLVRKNPLSNEASFWKLAFKRFPNKCRKSIVSYYNNVFITRRMSLQTRSSVDEIDSDDD